MYGPITFNPVHPTNTIPSTLLGLYDDSIGYRVIGFLFSQSATVFSAFVNCPCQVRTNADATAAALAARLRSLDAARLRVAAARVPHVTYDRRGCG